MGRTLRTKAHKALISELKLARKNAGCSQQHLAEKVGHPQSYIAKIENGERRVDVVEFLELIHAMGASWDQVLTQVDLAIRK